MITRNGWLTLASEIGVWDYAPEDVIEKGRVGPGEMLALNTGTGELWRSGAIDLLLKERHPYRHWLEQHSRVVTAEHEDRADQLPRSALEFKTLQKLFGLSREERESVLRVLAEDGQEAVGSMGDDTPMAVLSKHSRSLFDYFRQQFAQVTNPAIDPLREAASMTLTTRLGSEHNVFQEATGKAQRYVLHSPVLSHGVYRELLSLVAPTKSITTLHLQAALNESLEAAINRLQQQAMNAVESGSVLLVFSDREQSAPYYPVPALLVVGSVHQALVRAGKRTDANLIVETASARDPHHFAVLLGCGATAIYPWLAYEVIADLVDENDRDKALSYYRKGIAKGILKVMSKMGISAIQSYRGAQLFDAIGLHQNVISRCFPAISSPLGGADFAQLEHDLRAIHASAYDANQSLRLGGLLKYQFNGEYHAWNPDVVQSLQHAVKTGEWSDYQHYAGLVDNRPPAMLRDLLTFNVSNTALDVAAVEAVELIVKRFDSAAMSIGALSREAHETLAMAMNRLGARSNSGEGGEDPARYNTDKVSRIKQIASGRFGVTPSYLVNADVLQIKVAQGAKPGEGGQLPGDKVSAEIAALRFATPGVTLISPPPHHDIYSIEDLAQLIHDLRTVNPRALISVKLVALNGIGTIACGVVKCGADLITVSGYDGGTGAAPLTSVKYAGSPWELGLVEVQQALTANGLRDRVIVQVDGGFKTGRDVIKASLLGADSFGFGTGPMIAMGCKYLRICHLNNCATGIATQNDTLRREHFKGDVEKVMNFFQFIAQDVRHYLAQLGLKSLGEARGRAELLRVIDGQEGKILSLNIAALLETVPPPSSWSLSTTRHSIGRELNVQIANDVMQHIEKGERIERHYRVRNSDRTLGARLAGELATQFGVKGSPVAIDLHFRGIAGQSFGAFNHHNMQLTLEGDANDYVGKGMAGGRLILRAPEHSRFATELTPIMGNTCLYGATGGEIFANGRAGERFAVRNSGALAVVEGCGDHGCEYMTGGVVVVLGKTGRNFAAGMSGGIAFVYDADRHFPNLVNADMVEVVNLRDLHAAGFAQFLRERLQAHADLTGSRLASSLLREFSTAVQSFYVVKPRQFSLSQLLPQAVKNPTRKHDQFSVTLI